MRVFSSLWNNAIGLIGISFLSNANAFVLPSLVQSGRSSALSMSSNGYYFAAGDARVDMNVYNVGLEEAAEQWKAVVQAKTSMQDEGIFLNIHNSNKDLFVDTLTFTIDRSLQGGLGIGLLELAGGREDGLGITIVNELVEGGNVAQQTDIQPGDSIVQLSTSSTTSSTTGREEDKTVSRISTECLGYDATVDAIVSLPEEANIIQITVKRIRRQPKVTVTLQYPPSQKEEDVVLELFAGENLRRAMLARGVKLNDALAQRFDSGGIGDCGAEGTCATCIVNIPNKSNLLNPQSIQEQQILSKFPTRRLACKTVVGYGMTQGDLTVQVNPRQW